VAGVTLSNKGGSSNKGNYKLQSTEYRLKSGKGLIMAKGWLTFSFGLVLARGMN
jgi:hypothetical protein